MSGTNKLSQERNQRSVLELVQQPGNDICADCKARNPRWASHNLGIFICVNCASIHRKIGTHITKVKSLTMDSWTKEQVESMKLMGNIKSNQIYNSNEVRHPPPFGSEGVERDSELEQYIRSKYEYKRFVDKSALVASKLGPSRSASSPLTNQPFSAKSSVPSSLSVTENARLSSINSVTPRVLQTTDSKPLSQSRSVSQPITAPPPSQQQTSNIPKNGVWADLISLQPTTANSSLPLQYQLQQQSQFTGFPAQNPSMSSFQPTSLPMGGVGSLQTGLSTMGTNSYHQQPAFSSFHQQPQPNFSAASSSSPFTGAMQFTPQTLSQQPSSFAPQYSNQPQIQSPVAMNAQQPAQFLHPQPQSSLQVQVPNAQGGYLTPSPIPNYLSAPAGQQQFASHSPVQQFLSHSPQPQMQMQYPQQGQFLTPSPQLTMPNNSMQAQHQQQIGTPQPPFSSSPMQMSSQFMPGQPQMMSQGQYGGGFNNQMYGQTGYQAQPGQQQWGAF